MNEEIEYAEMLEIPVSTVNVVHKKHPKKRKSTTEQPRAKQQPQTALPTANDLKNSVIEQVNTQMQGETAEKISADAELFAESVNSEGSLNLGDVTERIDTVRLYSKEDKNLFEEYLQPHDYDFSDEEMQNEDTRYVLNKEKRSEKALKIALGVEFALSCALCGAIFLTNVFMPNSAINTFFKALTNTQQTAVDERTYTDFTLSPVVSDYSSAQLSLSASGVLSFTDKCCIYPAADGKVSEVVQNEDGSFTLKIAHSDSFSGVMTGLSSVFYQVGDTVKSNVPVAYSNGEAEVQVMMYSSGTLLNCFELTEENCLVWLQQE